MRACIDDAEHLPRALQMLMNLANGDAKKWSEIVIHAKISLHARLNFLTAVQKTIIQEKLILTE